MQLINCPQSLTDLLGPLEGATAFDRLTGLVVNPATNLIYASGAYGGTRVYDGNTNQAADTLPIYTVLGALDPQSNRLYFTLSGENAIAVVNGRTNEIEGTASGAQEGIVGLAMLSGCPVNCPCPCSCPCADTEGETGFNLLSAAGLDQQSSGGGTGPVEFAAPQACLNAKARQSASSSFELLEDGIYELNYHLETFSDTGYSVMFVLALNGAPLYESSSSAVNFITPRSFVGSGALIYARGRAGDTVQLLKVGEDIRMANAYISLRKVGG